MDLGSRREAQISEESNTMYTLKGKGKREQQGAHASKSCAKPSKLEREMMMRGHAKWEWRVIVWRADGARIKPREEILGEVSV